MATTVAIKSKSPFVAQFSFYANDGTVKTKLISPESSRVRSSPIGFAGLSAGVEKFTFVDVATRMRWIVTEARYTTVDPVYNTLAKAIMQEEMCDLIINVLDFAPVWRKSITLKEIRRLQKWLEIIDNTLDDSNWPDYLKLARMYVNQSTRSIALRCRTAITDRLLALSRTEEMKVDAALEAAKSLPVPDTPAQPTKSLPVPDTPAQPTKSLPVPDTPVIGVKINDVKVQYADLAKTPATTETVSVTYINGAQSLTKHIDFADPANTTPVGFTGLLPLIQAGDISKFRTKIVRLINSINMDGKRRTGVVTGIIVEDIMFYLTHWLKRYSWPELVAMWPDNDPFTGAINHALRWSTEMLNTNDKNSSVVRAYCVQARGTITAFYAELRRNLDDARVTVGDIPEVRTHLREFVANPLNERVLESNAEEAHRPANPPNKRKLETTDEEANHPAAKSAKTEAKTLDSTPNPQPTPMTNVVTVTLEITNADGNIISASKQIDFANPVNTTPVGFTGLRDKFLQYDYNTIYDTFKLFPSINASETLKKAVVTEELLYYSTVLLNCITASAIHRWWPWFDMCLVMCEQIMSSKDRSSNSLAVQFCKNHAVYTAVRFGAELIMRVREFRVTCDDIPGSRMHLREFIASGGGNVSVSGEKRPAADVAHPDATTAKRARV